MIVLGMKAAAKSADQIEDRISRLKLLQLPVLVELHTTGSEDIYDPDALRKCARVLRALQGTVRCEFVVHVPPQEPERVLRTAFDREQLSATVGFAHSIGATAVVLHRYFGFTALGQPPKLTKKEAEGRFYEELHWISELCAPLTALVENLGFYWLYPPRRRRALMSPLDHFFPWEMERHSSYVEAQSLSNVKLATDLAHAAISANMFNLRRHGPRELAADPTFANISAADLTYDGWLEPYDFLSCHVGYLHLSDAALLKRDELTTHHPIREERFWQLLTTEGRPLGTGDLDVARVVDVLESRTRRTTVIAEINPGPGDSHRANSAQEQAVRKVLQLAGSACLRGTSSTAMASYDLPEPRAR